MHMALVKALMLLLGCSGTRAAAPRHASDGWVTGGVLPSSIKKVYVVQACHLDVGFSEYAIVIVNKYFTEYFPKAIAIAATLAAGAHDTNRTTPRLRFMSQSWLLSLYLDCPASGFPAPPVDPGAPNCSAAPASRRDCGWGGMKPADCTAKKCCWESAGSSAKVPECFFASAGRAAPLQLACPSAEAVAAMRAALKAGTITQHAFPFNAEPEVLDADLFNFGLSMGKDVAKQIGIAAPTVMSQRDVPSMTRGVIPHLAKAGVIGVNIGINTASAPVDVPSVRACLAGELSKPFLWKDNATQSEVIAAFHPGGYGSIGRYNGPHTSTCDCIASPGLDEALCYGWVGDNGGPPSAAAVVANFEALSKQFVNAQIGVSTFDAFYAKLAAPAIKQQMEVVTQEAGDSWVYGCSSDPRKFALMRLFMRSLRAADLGKEHATEVSRFQRMLLKTSEHTWGTDGRCMDPQTGGDTKSWRNEDFEAVRPTQLFKQQEDAWHEQRGYFTAALSALSATSALKAAIEAEMSAFDALPQAAAAASASAGMKPVAAAQFSSSFKLAPADGTGGSLELALNPASGAIVQLSDSATKVEWASKANPLARFVYRSRSYEAGVDFLAHYQFIAAGWAPRVYEKIGSSGVANDTTSYGKITSMRRNASAVVVELTPPRMIATDFGGPQKLELIMSLPSRRQGLLISLVIHNKTTTRLPEEAWFEFRPALAAGATLTMEKLGTAVDPTHGGVLTNGSQTLHSVGDTAGTTFRSAGHTLSVLSFDAGLVSPGKAAENMDLYKFPGVSPAAADGCAVSLWNNLWSVNYVFWYPFAKGDDSFGYRFALRL